MPAAKNIVIILVGFAALSGVALQNRDKLGSKYQSTAPVITGGYLSQANLPDSLALLPPPPAPGSIEAQSDEAARQRALAVAGARYGVALTDTTRAQAETVQAFSCAFGTEISKERTPLLYHLLARMRIDARHATYRAKNFYRRAQPFVVHHTRTCLKSDEDLTRAEGSYPSARSSVGQAYALVLARLNPARSGEIMERGRQLGESRVICDAQWKSDVEAGRIVGEATVAQLHRTDAFQADFNAARAEVSSALASQSRPSLDCEREAETLAARGDNNPSGTH